MNTRIIPKSIPALITFSGRALAGLISRELALGIAQNTSARLTADRHNLIGEPGATPVIRGKEADWQLKREALTVARAALRAAKAAAREFASDAVDVLKVHLGRTWNVAWEAAGFTRGTLSTSRGIPLPIVLRIRGYLRDHPAHQVAPLNITAAQADARIAAVQTAEAAVDAAIVAHKVASAARNAAVQALRKRLTGLREELNQLLQPDDMRWLDFGFSRPVDGGSPGAITGLALSPAGAGKVLVEHDASPRATDYRISWKPQDGSHDSVDAGLFADLATTLNGLPAGVAIVVSVTARNQAGETPPAEATIIVP